MLIAKESSMWIEHTITVERFLSKSTQAKRAYNKNH